MDQSDIQKLRSLPIEGVAERLGLRVSRHKALCPYHQDSHPSLSFSPSRNGFKCFVCDAHGGTIDLTMRVLNLPFLEACRWLAGEHNVILSEWKPADKPAAPTTFDAARYCRLFDRPFLNDAARVFLFGERRLDPRVISWCRLSSWTDRQGTPWLQTPYYDTEGRLIGVQSRNLTAQRSSRTAQGSTRTAQGSSPAAQVAPRFRFPRGSKCHIYNLPVLQLLREGEPLFITEGASDCWAMLSSGHKAIAIPSATTLHETQLRKLFRWLIERFKQPPVLHIYPDQDIPGEKLYLRLTRLCTDSGLCLVRHSLPPGCKDYSDYYLSALSSSRSQPPKVLTVNA